MSTSSVREVDNRRVVTSAISDITVAEVRRSLSFIRKSWEVSQSDKKLPPMYLVNDIGIKELSIEKFALKFVSGHHSRRSAAAKGKTRLSKTYGESGLGDHVDE